MSVVIKGPSSAGKSHVLDSVLRFFPPAAFYCLTVMSERALAYSNESLKPRHLVIFEAAALTSGFATYLLSEGRMPYETVARLETVWYPNSSSAKGRRVSSSPPPTSAAPRKREPDAEFAVSDSQEQMAGIFRSLARRSVKHRDLGNWQALRRGSQPNLERSKSPSQQGLADLVPPISVRLRRDFKTILILIRAHALLHQASRRKR
jgi:hypothetical protein